MDIIGRLVFRCNIKIWFNIFWGKCVDIFGNGVKIGINWWWKGFSNLYILGLCCVVEFVNFMFRWFGDSKGFGGCVGLDFGVWRYSCGCGFGIFVGKWIRKGVDLLECCGIYILDKNCGVCVLFGEEEEGRGW